MSRRRTFGSIRTLPSGRFQARYTSPDGVRYRAPRSLATKAEASQWLATIESDLARGTWTDPDGGRITLSRYARGWTPAKSYRLLRTILNTALSDGLIARNPCAITGTGIERSAERPVASLAQVWALADAVPARFRALVLTAAFAGLRFGELAGLTRECVDLDAGTITVRQALVQRDDGSLTIGPPKSDAGRRTFAVPSALVPELADHLDRFVAPGGDALVFVGAKGARMRRSNWSTLWTSATKQVGVPGLRLHDLRHTCNTLTAATGASTRELMHRMGHASARAALRYQHATRDRDEVIAAALSDLIEASDKLSSELDE